jgi:hypothetical protein
MSHRIHRCKEEFIQADADTRLLQQRAEGIEKEPPADVQMCYAPRCLHHSENSLSDNGLEDGSITCSPVAFFPALAHAFISFLVGAALYLDRSAVSTLTCCSSCRLLAARRSSSERSTSTLNKKGVKIST